MLSGESVAFMITEFYQGRTILLTGGSGFLGQGLAAKILRDLPGIERLYLLLRSRRQTDGSLLTAAERLESEIFRADVFDRFRREEPEPFAAAKARTRAIEFDMGAPGLGLADADRDELVRHVDCVIGAAATVVFDEPLDLAVQVNTLGPQQLLELARQCDKQVVFVHVSTAYVSGQLQGQIVEAPLPEDRTVRQLMARSQPAASFDPAAEVTACLEYGRQVRELAETPAKEAEFSRQILSQHHNHSLSPSRLAKLVEDRRKRWIERQLTREGVRRAQAHGWNDVYTFTKAMGEQLLTRERGDVPLVIVRPSIVESSLSDPQPGWVFGLKVADPLIVGYGRGLVPDFPTPRNVVMDLVPVDVVVNTILAAATQASSTTVQVYHAATSGVCPLTMQQMYDYVRSYFQEYPMRGRDGSTPELPEWTFPSPWLFKLRFKLRYFYPLRAQQWLLARLPTRLAPVAQKRRLAALEKRLLRVLYYTELFGPYTRLSCRYVTTRAQALFESLPADDKLRFNMDIRRLEWRSYIREVHIPGLRRHVLREEQTEETLLREAPEELGDEEEQWRIEESIRTIPDLIRWSCARYGDAVALRATGKTQGARQYTYTQLQQAISDMGAYWESSGLATGQRVLLCAENSPEWVIAYMAASCLGLVVVPVDPQTPGREVWALAAFTGARALLVSVSVWDGLAPTLTDASPAVFGLSDGGLRLHGAEPSPAGARKGDWHPPAVEPDQLASIAFVSGTLVSPRGAMLSHRNFISDVMALAEIHRLGADDRVLSLLPLHHCLEFTGGMLLPLLGGASITYPGEPNSRIILDALRQHGITAVLTVPRLLKILVDRIGRLVATAGRGESIPELDALRSVRLLVSGGAPLPPVVFREFERLGILVHEGYGLTEAAPIVTVSPPGEPRAGSAGKAIPGVELRIRHPDEQGIGEILVRGPMVMQGYLNQPELTASVLRDGWLHTGDLGRVDADGYLWITGRTKQLVVTGAGKNVYPEEVEILYADLPHVVELAVVGVPSPRTLSEEVQAVAVVRRTESDDWQTVETEVRAATQRLAISIPSHQRIQRLHLWQRPLPRLDNGAVDRAAVQLELEYETEAAVSGTALPELADWELGVCDRIARMTGLTREHVAAHADAPLDTLMDSLMAIEFASVLENQVDGRKLRIDRAQMTLRQLLDHLKPQLKDGKHGHWSAAGAPDSVRYWSQVLADADRKSPRDTVPPGHTGGWNSTQNALWRALGLVFAKRLQVVVSGAEELPDTGPYLLAASPCRAMDALALVAAVRPHIEHCHLLAINDIQVKARWQDWLVRYLLNGAALDHAEEMRDTLMLARERVGVRRPLLVFSGEGRAGTSQPQPYRATVGLLACELDLPVVPVYIDLSRRRRSLRIGPPLHPAPFRDRADLLTPYEVYQEIAASLQRRIRMLQESA